MLSPPQRHVMLLACLLAAPALGLASSIVVNATCEAGTCPPVDTLASGGSTSGTFNFNYTFSNTDEYNIFGEYAATNPVSGDSTLQFNVTAVYAGNGTSSASQHDLLTIHDLQDYTVLTSLDGDYFEHSAAGIGGPIASASSFSAQLSFNGNGLGLLGPFTGPGSYDETSDLNLTGLTSPLVADFQFQFDFAAGSNVGSYITTAPVPEPGGMVPVAAILALGLGLPAIRRFRVLSRNPG